MFKMFRFLEKYVGTYRVKAWYDIDTGDFPRTEDGCLDPNYDDLYIPCAKGVIKHTYKKDTLMWYCDSIGQGHNVINELKAKYGDKLEFTTEETSGEVMIYFNDADIKKVATIVKPRTSGASIRPYSDKNLPKPTYEIPSGDLAKLYAVTKDMDRTDKMLFFRKAVTDFDPYIIAKKGKKFNLEKDRRESRLKPKVYIHYIGMWDDFVEFVKKEYAKL